MLCVHTHSLVVVAFSPSISCARLAAGRAIINTTAFIIMLLFVVGFYIITSLLIHTPCMVQAYTVT